MNHYELTVLPPWLQPVARQLLTTPESGAHALLLHGQAGIGKRRLAVAIARGLLCESTVAERRSDGGCDVCVACRWFDQGNHPDYRKVVPESVAAAEGLDVVDDASDPDPQDVADRGVAKSKRAPSKEIKVDQVRALQAFLSVGTHRSRFRVVVLYPLESLNDVAANALLKMLEEPPAGTVFVLVADRLGRIPATLLSRCRKVFVTTPPVDVASRWLAAQGIDDPEGRLASAGGAPLDAAAFAQDEPANVSRRELLAFLSRPGIDASMAAAEAFARTPVAPLIHWLQQWMADCVASRLAGRIRYHPAQSTAIASLAKSAELDAMMRLTKRLDALRRSVDHPLNARLLLEGVLTAYVDAMIPART